MAIPVAKGEDEAYGEARSSQDIHAITGIGQVSKE